MAPRKNVNDFGLARYNENAPRDSNSHRRLTEAARPVKERNSKMAEFPEPLEK